MPMTCMRPVATEGPVVLLRGPGVKAVPGTLSPIGERPGPAGRIARAKVLGRPAERRGAAVAVAGGGGPAASRNVFLLLKSATVPGALGARASRAEPRFAGDDPI